MRRLLPVAFFLFVTALTLGGTVVHADSDAASGLVPVRQGDAPMLKIIPRSTDLAAATPYVYKHVDGVELKLYVFEPLVRLGDEPVPAVIFFFGGAWTAGRVEQFVPQSEYLAMPRPRGDRCRLSGSIASRVDLVRQRSRCQVSDTLGEGTRSGARHRSGSHRGRGRERRRPFGGGCSPC